MVNNLPLILLSQSAENLYKTLTGIEFWPIIQMKPKGKTDLFIPYLLMVTGYNGTDRPPCGDRSIEQIRRNDYGLIGAAPWTV